MPTWPLPLSFNRDKRISGAGISWGFALSMKIPARRLQGTQQSTVIDQPLRDQMHDFAFALQHAVDAHHPGTQQFAPLEFPE
jgi:hypothetical protein